MINLSKESFSQLMTRLTLFSDQLDTAFDAKKASADEWPNAQAVTTDGAAVAETAIPTLGSSKMEYLPTLRHSLALMTCS